MLPGSAQRPSSPPAGSFTPASFTAGSTIAGSVTAGPLAALALLLALSSALLSAPPLAADSWQITSADGESSVKFGYLAVMRGDSVELDSGENAENFFFRRLRFLVGGKLDKKWTFFMETDSPNLGKSDTAGNRNSGDIFIQDFYVTYNHRPSFKLDFGLILIPISRNSTQSAATHLAADYGPFSFLNSAPTNSRVGRDYGIQARGHLADNRFEYRLGIYDGARGDDAAEDFRFAGRVMFHALEPETGMFYTGNNLGTKRQLSFGLSFDSQDDYTAIGADVFYDQPVGDDGSAFTLQADLIHYDGGDTFLSLPEQSTMLIEAGYYFGASGWQPWLQYAERDFDDPTLADEERLFVGINYRLKKHNRLIRLAYGQLSEDGRRDRDVVELTLQVFKF